MKCCPCRTPSFDSGALLERFLSPKYLCSALKHRLSGSLSPFLPLMLSVLQGYLFHTVTGKHQDLKYIDSEMVCAAGTGGTIPYGGGGTTPKHRETTELWGVLFRLCLC